MLFGELADALAQRGHEVVLVQAAQPNRESQGRVASLLRELSALIAILWRGIFCRRVQVVVSGSSPPCLAVAGALVSLRHWAPHLHWCMELYPEIAIALREIRPGILPSIIRMMMRSAYRWARAVVGLDADMVAALGRHGVRVLECRPWVPAPVLAQMPALAAAPVEPWTWLYSGSLGHAHDWQTLLAAQAALEERGVDATLVFQGGGPARDAARARADELNLRRVVWRPYAPEAELCKALLRAQCLVATQLPETAGLLWPSKLALLFGLPRSLLFVGPKTGAIAALLRNRAHAGVVASGDFRAVADWITRLRSEPLAVPPQPLVDVAAHRWGAIAWWVELIEGAKTK